MATLIIDYALSGDAVSNPDGSLPATVNNCAPVAGPGDTVAGNFAQALDFGASGKINASVPAAKFNVKKFCVRCIFKTDNAVTARENLVESTALPFSMFLDKGNTPNDYKLAVSVNPAAHGWSGTNTGFFKTLETGTWYVADLVYDVDTVAVFIDGVILSVHAFPKGTIKKTNSPGFYIGTWVDRSRNHFNGCIAAVQVYDDIPLELETQLDERRGHPEWFITYKYESIHSTLNFGQPTEKYKLDPAANAHVQHYQNGLIMYNAGIGTAFEMHGAIRTYYLALAEKNELGYLVSDEGPAGLAGARKSLFQKGGIYWSSATGAVMVSGQIYLDYEMMGEAAWIGMPKSKATSIANGREQIFQGARMYHKNGSPKAHEVHGAILARYLATGTVGAWGYPTSNETDVKRNGSVIGKQSEFEGCTIYWSSGTGAFEIYGAIREEYRRLNGPLSELGFPTSGEANIPGASAPARYNTFKGGSILWFGGGGTFVCYPFQIYLGRIDSKESEGFLMGQNDLYMRAIIDDNGHELYRKRYPNTGDYGGHNVIEIGQEIPFRITPNRPDLNIKFTLDIWESDDGAPFGGGDDHLGTYHKTLNMANAWGLKENNGVFNSGSFQSINSITWAVHPKINEAGLSETQKWWGVTNKGTATISKAQYAAAFRDVDSDPEWWDLTDWLEKAFYELVIKGIAANGNCFGMSLEGIYARKHRSLFSLPIDRFTSWNQVVNEFNIRHQYQAGAEAIWWFVGQFLSGNTHDPKDVFNETRNCFARGDNPVLCIAQNWDFSGAPHCVMPVAWNSSGKPWRMTIMDPNFPGKTKEIQVDPDKNEFTYVSTSSKVYKGGAWSGGRMHYMPYCVLNERPRTPIWDAILLILAGTIIILGEDVSTQSLTDENGVDLDAFGTDAINRMKSRKPLDNKFVHFKGFDSKSVRALTSVTKARLSAIVKQKQTGVLANELLLRSVNESSFQFVNPGLFGKSVIRNSTMAELSTDRAASRAIQPLLNNEALMAKIRDREVKHVVSDKKLLGTLDANSRKLIEKLAASGPLGNDILHNVVGLRNGSLEYAVKCKLNQFIIRSGVKQGEVSQVKTKELGTHSSEVDFTAGNAKTFSLEIDNKLGVKNDHIRIRVDRIPALKGKPTSMSIKPGLAGLDIVAAGDRTPAVVTVESVVDGKTSVSKFKMDIEGGMRIRPSTILTDNELKVGRIDTLHGQLIDSHVILPQ